MITLNFSFPKSALFTAEKLPEIGSGLGKPLWGFKDAVNRIEKETFDAPFASPG
jgi:Sec-independent protein translocase protein TatA